MPTKKPKSNVANRAKKSSFKFRWWYAVIAILVVAIVGIAVLRFSHAGTRPLGKITLYCAQGSCYNTNAAGRSAERIDVYADDSCPSYPYAIAMSYTGYKKVCVGP
jgi:hypothetical protein